VDVHGILALSTPPPRTQDRTGGGFMVCIGLGSDMTPITSQYCMAMSFDTRNAIARFSMGGDMTRGPV
jgi:hypothetical protein